MRRALELAWEAFQSGSFPVGAVVVGADGEVIAEGRNRIGEAEAPAGRLRGTGIAHAEIDVLGQLPFGDHRDKTLYTSLEPCLFCRAAITQLGIGHVHYLAADAFCVGLDGLSRLAPHIEARAPMVDGPCGGIEARFASVLPMAVLLLFGTSPAVIDLHEQLAPADLAAARRLVSEDRWPPRRLSLDEAIEHLRPILPSS